MARFCHKVNQAHQIITRHTTNTSSHLKFQSRYYIIGGMETNKLTQGDLYVDPQTKRLYAWNGAYFVRGTEEIRPNSPEWDRLQPQK